MNVRDALARMPARQLHLMGVAVLLAAGGALWLGVLQKPLSGLRATYAEQATLAGASADLARLQARASALETLVRVLREGFGAAGHADGAGEAEIQLRLVRDLGALAAAGDVALMSIRPTPAQRAMIFVQSGFDIEARGSYAALLAWIEAIERSPSGLAISRFELRATTSAGTLEMRAHIASYGLEEKA